MCQLFRIVLGLKLKNKKKTKRAALVLLLTCQISPEVRLGVIYDLYHVVGRPECSEVSSADAGVFKLQYKYSIFVKCDYCI